LESQDPISSTLPQPLGYQSSDLPHPFLPKSWPAIGGVILSIAAWGFSGVVGATNIFWYVYRYPPPLTAARQPSPAASYAAGYVVLTMLAVVVFAALPRHRRRGFILGLLIGTALTGLTEGLCFLSM
jgi:hypothetical protein